MLSFNFSPKKIIYYFPVALFLLYIKQNLLLLCFWVILFGCVAFGVGQGLGLPYLFLDPEYAHQVWEGGLFITGSALGVFTMAFHIAAYILHGAKFPFLTRLRRPFACFMLNNSIIPLVFLVVYLGRFAHFQYTNGLEKPMEILLEILAFLSGYGMICGLTLLYFHYSGRDIFNLFSKKLDTKLRHYKLYRVNVLSQYGRFKKDTNRVDFWLIGWPLRWQETLPFELSESITGWQDFRQTHLRAILLEVIAFAALLALGAFREVELVALPAAASILILFAFVLMLLGALHYWLGGWLMAGLLVLIFGFGLLEQLPWFDNQYQAFGIDYSKKSEYSAKKLATLSSPQLITQDKAAMQQILEKRVAALPPNPVLVFVCASGGGQRAAFWTFRALQAANQHTNGDFMRHAALITGASGGMLGAAYYRELYMQSLQNPAIRPDSALFLERMGSDMLNGIAFALIINDLFVKFQKFKDENYTYTKDRGYAFELQLNRNTHFALHKRLKDYQVPEQMAQIPVALLAPIIINDSRRLYICAQKVAFMTSQPDPDSLLSPQIRAVEFQRLLQAHNPENLYFTSALRLNATFPLITPNVSLPTQPAIKVMDAGIADNFGIADALRFIYQFKNWINANTSGVVLVLIRDSDKNSEPDPDKTQRSLSDKFFAPISSLYHKWGQLQDEQNDTQIAYAKSWLGCPLHTIHLQYLPKNYADSLPSNTPIGQSRHLREQRASLNWHLTKLEKQNIANAINNRKNRMELDKLKILLAK